VHTRKETNKKNWNYIQKYESFLRRGTHARFLTQHSTQRRKKMGNKQNKATPFSSEIKPRYTPIFRADGGVHKNSPTTAM